MAPDLWTHDALSWHHVRNHQYPWWINLNDLTATQRNNLETNLDYRHYITDRHWFCTTRSRVKTASKLVAPYAGLWIATHLLSTVIDQLALPKHKLLLCSYLTTDIEYPRSRDISDHLTLCTFAEAEDAFMMKINTDYQETPYR